MKKRNKIITGLIIGGAIGSVLGVASKRKKDSQGSSSLVEGVMEKIENTNKKMDEMMKPKRKGSILRFLDWLEKKGF